MTLKNVIKPHVVMTGAFFLVLTLTQVSAKSIRVPNCNPRTDSNCFPQRPEYPTNIKFDLPQTPSGCTTFVEAEYLNLHPDVKAAVERGSYPSGFYHFMHVGRRENRQICGKKLIECKTFVEKEYLELYPDVAKAVKELKYKSGFEHYMKVGQHEKRPVCKF